MIKSKLSVVSPALFLSVGLFPLVMISVNLKVALIYSALIFLTWFFSFLLISAFRIIINERIRFICYALVVVAVIYLLDSAVYELFSSDYNSVSGIIMALFGSGVVFYELDRTKDDVKFKQSLGTSFYIIVSYVLSCVVVGGIREILSSGTIMGASLFVGFNGIPFFNELAGGLLIVVVVAFIHNIIIGIIGKRKATKEYLKERYLNVIEDNFTKEA